MIVIIKIRYEHVTLHIEYEKIRYEHVTPDTSLSSMMVKNKTPNRSHCTLFSDPMNSSDHALGSDKLNKNASLFGRTTYMVQKERIQDLKRYIHTL